MSAVTATMQAGVGAAMDKMGAAVDKVATETKAAVAGMAGMVAKPAPPPAPAKRTLAARRPGARV